MDPTVEQLRNYYEVEAAGRLRPVHGDRRRRVRETFVELVTEEGRRSIVDVGAGPAVDGSAFVDAGLTYVGVDLAVGNAVIAAERGLGLVPASLFELPFRTATFDCGWSMSTLQHVPDARFHEAMREIVRVLRPGAPLGLGLWGGHERVLESTGASSGLTLPRHFTLRSHERTTAMLSEHGTVERFDTFPDGDSDWEYQVVVLRTPI